MDVYGIYLFVLRFVPSCSAILYIYIPTIGSPNAYPLRTVILMWITILSGGAFFMENPLNSLVAMHHRYIWMVERLKEFGIPAAQRIFGLNFVFPHMGLCQNRGCPTIVKWFNLLRLSGAHHFDTFPNLLTVFQSLFQ